MAGVYSTLFAQGRLTAAGGVAVYTVPVGMVAIVRDVSLEVGVGGSGYMTVFSRSGVSTDSPIYSVGSAVALGYYHWAGMQVLNAGDVIRFYSEAIPASYRISGYLLASLA